MGWTRVVALALLAGCSAPTGDVDAGVRLDSAIREDAGSGVDGGNSEDAGEPDAGSREDGGTDAGTDAGMDAGTDAGMDAGTDAGTDAGMDASGGADGGQCPCPNSGACESVDDIICAPAPDYPCSSGDGWYGVCTEGGWECRFTTPAIC